jgi:histidinol-phosphatase (PHP family)
LLLKNFHDSHVHSRNSHDGAETVEAICVEAIKRGLAGIAVTDHCDIHNGRRACAKVKRGLLKEARRARERFEGELDISIGMEIGEPHHDIELAGELAGDPEIDFVIGSLHMMRGEPDFYYMDFDKADMDYVFRKYYDELCELAECRVCDVMGHVNSQVRYMSASMRESVDLGKYGREISAVLESMTQNGMGLEVNTSCMRFGEKGVVPSPKIMREFRALGGKIATTGADAHHSRDVGNGLSDAVRLLGSAGFEKYAFFKKRRPTFFDVSGNDRST